MKDWPPLPPAWDTPTGRLLSALAAAVPEDRNTPILLFGSGALQFTVTPGVLSHDTDIAPDIVAYDPDLPRFPRALSRRELAELAARLDCRVGARLQVCSPDVFRSTPLWPRRAVRYPSGRLEITVPHPMDILIPKLARAEVKDGDNLMAVREACGGWPTENELIREMRSAFDLFKKPDESPPSHLPGQIGTDRQARTRLRRLWKQAYGRELNVEHEIVQPAAAEQARHWHDYPTGLKEEL